MNIKKRFKKEKTSITRTIIISLVIMILMPYMVVILNDQGIFKGWEFYFALAYAILVDLLLVYYIFKNLDDKKLVFEVSGRKIRIKDSLVRFSFSIPLDKIIYIDVIERKNQEFSLFILMRKGKRNKRFISFNIGYAKLNPQYKRVYEHFNSPNEIVDYHLVLLNRGGAKKFYLLYLIFKNAYNAEITPKALDYVKKFMEEYNMA